MLTILFLYSWEVFKKMKMGSVKIKKDEWRGISVSMSTLPKPDWIPKLGKYNSDEFQQIINKKLEQYITEINFQKSHSDLLSDILFYIKKFGKDSFVGAGHAVSLYEHTLSVLTEAWTPDCDPLIPIAAAAHDAGKILAWKKNPKSESWEKVGFHDDYGMLLISSLPSFLELSEDEQLVLKIVIGYAHKENQRPILKKNLDQRVEEILSVVNAADRKKTAQEKEEVLEKNKAPEVVTDAFLRALINSPFNTPKSKRGDNSICFKKGNVVYLLEPGFRDLFLNELHPDIAAAFGTGFRRIGNMSAPTVALINHLKKIGWLVETGNGMTSECGLWSINIGRKLFNGVLAVNLPPDIAKKLPDNSNYEVVFSCPLKIAAGEKLVPDDAPIVNEILEKEELVGLTEEELLKLEKKARQLSAITRQDFNKILIDLTENYIKEKTTQN